MTTDPFNDYMTLGEARARLRELVEDGHTCPCCSQFAKVYPRRVHSTMARALIALYRRGAADDYIHAPSATKRDANAETAKLVYWNLIEQAPGKREDGGRPGWYRLTPFGHDFVRGHATVQRTAHVYDNRVLRRSGPQVTIQDCLGDKFNYAELMGWAVA